MSTVLQDPPVRTGLERYISRCGGSDVLEFTDNQKAITAASLLRKEGPQLKIEARFNRVFIRTNKEPA